MFGMFLIACDPLQMAIVTVSWRQWRTIACTFDEDFHWWLTWYPTINCTALQVLTELPQRWTEDIYGVWEKPRAADLGQKERQHKELVLMTSTSKGEERSISTNWQLCIGLHVQGVQLAWLLSHWITGATRYPLVRRAWKNFFALSCGIYSGTAAATRMMV